MHDFAVYIACLGIPESEMLLLQARIRSWADLHRLLDERPLPHLQPHFRRTALIPPRLRLSLKDSLRRLLLGQAVEPEMETPPQPRGWERLVESRRRMTLMLTLATTVALLLSSAATLNAEKMPGMALHAYLFIYGLMTYFLASNTYKLILGTWHASRDAESNPWHPSRHTIDPEPGVKVAIVYPVLHENVPRVAAGMAATWRSIVRDHPDLAIHFDNFMLSDSRSIEHWIAEEAAIHELSSQFPEGRFYYRRRPMNRNAKLGNITDFCRRWGYRYKYMLVMDADSIMDGKACVTLLRMMEGTPSLGILQTNPKPILRQSLFGRMQQFAGRLYGSVFSYSLQAIYMGNACYIGHNAMIRMAPFIRHCVLPRLSGRPPWGGKPLSHDIIESALMARAGYEVWFLPDIEGSYEEMPANILDFLIRERRWMQGNLQHLRFVTLDGLRSIHREVFLNGSMGYLSAPLWAGFLVISGYGMIHFLKSALLDRKTFSTIELPMFMLAMSALVFLFMPRFLALALHIRSDVARLYGGKDKLIWSMLIETVFSFFFSPIIMIYISRFMWLWLKRRSISWGDSQRDDGSVPWSACYRHFVWVTGIGVFCGVVLQLALNGLPSDRVLLIETLSRGWLTPGSLMIGYLPIIGGLAASTLIVRLTSQTFPFIRDCKLFCIPEEIETPAVLQDMHRYLEMLRERTPDPATPGEALKYALTDPEFYVRHRPQTQIRARIANDLLPKIEQGIDLGRKELLLALSERSCFDRLHASKAYALLPPDVVDTRMLPSAAST